MSRLTIDATPEEREVLERLEIARKALRQASRSTAAIRRKLKAKNAWPTVKADRNAVRSSPDAINPRRPREKDADHHAFVHEVGLCIACLIEGEPNTRGEPNPIESAHQKLAIATKGWKGAGKGSRGDDRTCLPLCRWHHQLAPNACDKAQRKFWDRLGIGDAVADLCAALVKARPDPAEGVRVIRDFASKARA